MMKKSLPIVEVKIAKLVHGGQGMGLLPDASKCFVWGALPGEVVQVQLTKRKKDWTEGYAVQVLQPSGNRIEPKEPNMYLATSPWQILYYAQEAIAKQAILAESFQREGVSVQWQPFYQQDNPFNYRNKMEYNFWYDNDSSKVSLALHKRGSHQKVAVQESALASHAINNAGKELITYINKNRIEARPLKSVILRSSSAGTVGVSLFVNDVSVAVEFANLNIPNSILEVVYSNPKSPASVATQVLQPADEQLFDTLLGNVFNYSTRSFFQVNIPVYERVLKIISAEVAQHPTTPVLDLYSGVGSIGLSVVSNSQQLTMVETSQECTDQAKLNMVGRANVAAITTTAESAIEYITGKEIVIVDPPRAGLHKHVTKALCAQKPSKIVYLSCNPSTQARDVNMLVAAGYKIAMAQGFNFFPRTPHIESLIILSI